MLACFSSCAGSGRAVASWGHIEVDGSVMELSPVMFLYGNLWYKESSHEEVVFLLIECARKFLSLSVGSPFVAPSKLQ